MFNIQLQQEKTYVAQKLAHFFSKCTSAFFVSDVDPWFVLLNRTPQFKAQGNRHLINDFLRASSLFRGLDAFKLLVS